MDYAEKKQARIDRFLRLADKLKQESLSKSERANKMADVIPFGQPILVGHHSEGRDRRYRARIGRLFDSSSELQNKADYYKEKARSAQNNKSISSDDPEAITRLKEKITNIEKLNEQIKLANKAIKKAKTEAEKIDAYMITGISREKAIQHYGFAQKNPYWESFKTDTAEIRRCKDRIKRLENIAQMEKQEILINGVNIVINPEENRVQMFLLGKPNYNIIQELKRSGFRWSRFNGCWQAYINRWNIDRAKDIASKV